MKIIGLDIGTTSLCGIRMDCGTGTVEKAVNRANGTWIMGEEPWEKIQNPNQIRVQVLEILEELAVPGVEAIGVTGQMHGMLYLDNQGLPLGPLYTWQDGRGNLVYQEKTYAQWLDSHTGYGNVTHFYNRRNGLVPEQAVTFCAIHDYLVMVLTGRKTPLVHSSDAASFGAYNLAKENFIWKDSMQPQVTPETAVAGTWRNIPVAVAIGDNQASFIGGGCDQKTLLINVGTGSQVSFMTNTPDTGSGLEVRPLPEDQFLLVGSSLCGGRAYAVLEHFFRQTAAMIGVERESLYEVMAKEAEQCPATDLIFETLFCGRREEPEKRATLSQLSPENFTPGDLIRSCIHGIGNELLEIYQKGGGSCTRLVGTGNGIRRNAILRQTISQLFGMEMKVPMFCEEAAVGAALFAATACEKYQSLDEAKGVVRYDI